MLYTQIIKTIFVCTFFCCLACFCYAQTTVEKSLYHFAIGLKCYEPGISIKISSAVGDAAEWQVFHSACGTKMGMLYEIQTKIKDELIWYAGGGAHLTLWDKAWKKSKHLYGSDGSIGIDAIIGLDYRPMGMPFDISLDWQPLFTFMGAYNGKNKLTPFFGGIGFRVVL